MKTETIEKKAPEKKTIKERTRDRVEAKIKGHQSLTIVRDTINSARNADETAIHKRLEKQIAPWVVGSSVASLALTGLAMNPGYDVGFGALSIAAVTAGLYLPKALDMSFVGNLATWARSNKIHTWMCASAAWVWYTMAVIMGVGEAKTLTLTGVSALLLLSARWWQEYRIGYPDTDLVEASPLDEMIITETIENLVGEDDKIIAKWAKNVAGSGGALPGTRLSGREEVKNGVAYSLDLVPGKQTIQNALSALPLIATALGVPQRNLIVEEVHPTEDNLDPDPAILRFQVITNSPIRKIVPLNGPTWKRDGDDLWIELGLFADGEGIVRWKVFTENSMWGGYVVGDTGQGKSVISDTIGMSLMDTGLVTVFYIDPQNGTSSPGLFKNADWAIGNDPARWDRMLTGLETLVNIRSAENAVRLGTGGFTATPARPGVMVIIDECHVPFRLWPERFANVARQGRKVGVAMIGLSQIYGLKSFGEDEALRQSLCGGNTVALKVSRNNASLIDGMPINPADLPDIPGYGIVVSPDPKFGRTAPFRGFYAKEEARKTMMAHVAPSMAKLDDLAIGALDSLTNDVYSMRDFEAEADLVAMETLLRNLEQGIKVSMPKTPTPAKAGEMPNLEDFREEAAPGAGLVGVKKLIYEAIKNGTTSTGALLELAKSKGFTSESWVYDALRELVEDQLISKGSKQGSYLIKEVAS